MYRATSKYYPVKLENASEIPSVFAPHVKWDNDERHFSYCLHIPSAGTGVEARTSWLLLLNESVLQVVERVGDEVKSTHIPYDSVFFIERGCSLLYSWLDVKAQSNEEMINIHVEFNTAKEELMLPVVEKLRRCYCTFQEDEENNKLKLAFLKEENKRLLDYAENYLMPICDVQKLVYQPEIQKPFTRRPRDNNHGSHLTLVCSKELVDIAETRLESANAPAATGAVWRYIPLKSIKNTKINTKSTDHTIRLVLELEANDKETFIYDDKIKDMVSELF